MIPSPTMWIERMKLNKTIKNLKNQLHLKMEIDAESMRRVVDEKKGLEKKNENLRITLQTLQNKPGRSEYRMLYVYDKAISAMQSQAPGFAPTWQMVLKNVEDDMKKVDQGFIPLIKRTFSPSFSSNQSVMQINQD